MERVDELGRKGYRLIQETDAFCFGVDAVFLADFVRAEEGARVLDMGTGSGILPLLLDMRGKGGSFVGLELQPRMAALARRNVRENGLEARVEIVEGDLCEASARFGRASFDVVVSNPPYMPPAGGLVNPDAAKAIARHELKCTLRDVLREAAAVLAPGGRFFCVHRPARLAELLSGMQEFHLEPKRMRLVHSFADGPAELVLAEGVRGGRPQMTVEPPLIVYREKGLYTDEVRRMYTGEEEGA